MLSNTMQLSIKIPEDDIKMTKVLFTAKCSMNFV